MNTSQIQSLEAAARLAEKLFQITRPDIGDRISCQADAGVSILTDSDTQPPQSWSCSPLITRVSNV